MSHETSVQRAARRALAGVMMTVGVLHFSHGEVFASIVPPYLPSPLALVYVSGVAELALGLGLLFESTRWLAAWGLVALFLAVFPANIHWALHPELKVAGLPDWMPAPSETALWLRLPLQFVFIAWALRFTKRPASEPSRELPA